MFLKRPFWLSLRRNNINIWDQLLFFTPFALIHIIVYAMPKSPLEKTVENGISFLSKVFPLKTYLYFPLLNATLFWAIRKAQEWKEEIFSWKVWLDPDRIETKPDEFVLNFFENHTDLNRIYESEIRERDWAALREAFARLYPILGLGDPFLSALFHEEIESENYRKIVSGFEERVNQAEKDIETLEGQSGLLKGLKTFADQMLSLNLDLISQDKVQTVLAGLIKKHFEEKDE